MTMSLRKWPGRQRLQVLGAWGSLFFSSEIFGAVRPAVAVERDQEVIAPASSRSSFASPAATADVAESATPSPLLPAARVSIDLRQAVEVESSRLMLEQVASCNITATTGVDCAEVLAVDISAAPPAGKTNRLGRASIKEILANEFPGVEIQVNGADSVFVSAKGVLLEPDSLAAPFSRQIDEVFGQARDFRIQVLSVRLNGRPTVRPGEVSCRFAQLDLIAQRSSGEDPSLVEAEIENLMTRLQNGAQLNAQCLQGDDEPPVFVQFSPKLQVERRMPVAATDLAQKSLFRAGDATWAWVPWTRSATRALRDPGALAGLSVVRPVQTGQLLLLKDFERPVAIRRGDTVQLLQRNGDLTVTTNAVAIGQGAIGDAVEVQSVATKKRVRAMVQSSSVVEAM
jgi:flagella basal body P-ring formation protein FlgA